MRCASFKAAALAVLLALSGCKGCCERPPVKDMGTGDMNACLSCNAVENPCNDLGLHCIRGCCGAIADMRACGPCLDDNDCGAPPCSTPGVCVSGMCVFK